MLKEKLFVAFDTSNYTTSCSVCTESGVVLQNLKFPLPVSQGQRGLRQSDALFHHINQMPELIDKLEIDGTVLPQYVLASLSISLPQGKANPINTPILSITCPAFRSMVPPIFFDEIILFSSGITSKTSVVPPET